MSDTTQTPGSTPATDADAIADANGYSTETAAAETAPNTSSRKADAELKRRNLAATFGSGPGKLSLIAVAVIVVVFGALAAGQFRKSPEVASKAQVDAPTTPPTRVTTNTVTPDEAARRAEQSRLEAEQAQNKAGVAPPPTPRARVTTSPVPPDEAARRAEQSRLEAEQAQNKGASYQPGFDYNIGQGNKQETPPNSAKFSGFETRDEETTRAHATNGSAQNLQTQANGQNSPQRTQQQQAEQQRREQEMQRAADKLATEQKTAEGERDKFVASVSDEIVKQIGGMFSSQGADSLNNIGAYSQTTYYHAQPQSGSNATERAIAAHRVAARKAIIKAGSTAFATLDSEANTDDGRTVLATVRSGKWKGAKLIGQIEQSYNNMSLTFTIMAPQDDRPTMRVRAVALREVDAKLGMAEKIDHHTLSRYSALATAALLQGAGRVYQQPIGTTTVTNGGIVTTTPPPTDRQVVGSAVGELGMAIGSEIRRRGYNQPSTYSPPAETGFVLYFLEDVLPQSGDEQQQQQQQQPQNTQVNPVNAPTNAMFPATPFPQGGGAPPGYSPGYGSTPYGYNPGGYGNNQYPGGFDNRYRGPLNSN